MKHKESFFTFSEGIKIYYQCWLPEGEPKAVVMIEHGLAEHGGRYLNVANQLVPAGFAVYAVDQYGHGKSDGARVFIPRFEVFSEILKSFFDLIRAEYPDKKIFLLGHSMGSLISACYLLRHQDDLAGAVLTGVFTRTPDNITPLTVSLSKVLSKLVPKAGVTAIDAAAVSRDPEVVEAYDNDPLVYRGKVTARLGAETLRGFQKISEEQQKIELPILLMQGTEDKLVNPENAQALYDNISSEDKTLKYYQDYYHEVFNDLGKEQVLEDLQAWLEAHL